jgi:hypothetical protein
LLKVQPGNTPQRKEEEEEQIARVSAEPYKLAARAAN